MIDKTEIYLYLHSEYALRINITRSERIEDWRKKVVVRKEKRDFGLPASVKDWISNKLINEKVIFFFFFKRYRRSGLDGHDHF